MFIFVISFTILSPFQAYAGTSTQTDWSGGDGIWGPVIDWSSEYFADTDIEYFNYPSNIVLQKTMAPTPLEHTIDGSFSEPVSIYSADLNEDGHVDILGTEKYGHNITWWENVDGSGTNWAEHLVTEDVYSVLTVHAADVNNDDHIDVLGAVQGLWQVTWWENDGTGTTWTEHIVDAEYAQPMSAYAADLNGDGYMDVLGTSFHLDVITWWESSDSTGTSWTEHTIDTFDDPEFAYAEDINGDGYMDVLGMSIQGGDIAWWENDGSGTSWTKHMVNTSGVRDMHSADINDDGYMDVVSVSSIEHEVVWWENTDGSGTSWTKHIIDINPGGFPLTVYASDLNRNGYIDVMGAYWADSVVAWWENVDGAGTSWTKHVISGDYDIEKLLYSTDVNGDGWGDVLGGPENDNKVIWWDLTEYLAGGSLESSVLDVQESPDWQTLLWDCTEPAGTSVAFQVRASTSSSDMGAWSDTLADPCTLEGILADEDNYFQYRAILNTTDPLLTPTLQEVTVGWQPFTGTQEGSGGEVTQFALYGAQPNPALGHASLVFALPVNSWAELTVYDLTGRVVRSVSGEYEPGLHEVILDGLASGMYMVRMTSEGLTATRQFVVIE